MLYGMMNSKTTAIIETHGPTTSSNIALSKTVLIVEPMPDRQWKLARIFTVSGYRVIGASVVSAAKALLETCPVNLILLSPDACVDDANATGELSALSPNARILMMQPDIRNDEGQNRQTRDEKRLDDEEQNDERVDPPVLSYVARPERMSDVAALAYG